MKPVSTELITFERTLTSDENQNHHILSKERDYPLDSFEGMLRYMRKDIQIKRKKIWSKNNGEILAA